MEVSVIARVPIGGRRLEGLVRLGEGRVRLPGALSSASPGVPGNCRKRCSIPGKLPGDTIIAPVGQSRNIDRACVVMYFR